MIDIYFIRRCLLRQKPMLKAEVVEFSLADGTFKGEEMCFVLNTWTPRSKVRGSISLMMGLFSASCCSSFSPALQQNIGSSSVL